MFGSIIQPKDQVSDETIQKNNSNESNTLNDKDPWDDTSLIQFWHNSIGSYKIKHSKSLLSESNCDPLQEKLDESAKHKLSSESQSSTQKRQKVRHNDQSSTPATKSEHAAVKISLNKTNNKISMENKEEKEEEGEDQEEEVVNENEYYQQQGEGEEEEEEEEEEVEKEDKQYNENEQVENENNHDYYQNYYSYGQQYHQYPQQHNYYSYPYAPPPPPPPPPSSSTMPFPPPPPPIPGLSTSAPHPTHQQQDNELLTNLIMAWYYSGYYTGLYQAQQRQ